MVTVDTRERQKINPLTRLRDCVDPTAVMENRRRR